MLANTTAIGMIVKSRSAVVSRFRARSGYSTEKATGYSSFIARLLSVLSASVSARVRLRLRAGSRRERLDACEEPQRRGPLSPLSGRIAGRSDLHAALRETHTPHICAEVKAPLLPPSAS